MASCVGETGNGVTAERPGLTANGAGRCGGWRRFGPWGGGRAGGVTWIRRGQASQRRLAGLDWAMMWLLTRLGGLMLKMGRLGSATVFRDGGAGGQWRARRNAARQLSPVAPRRRTWARRRKVETWKMVHASKNREICGVSVTM